MNAEQRAELKAMIDAERRRRVQIGCPNGYARGTTGYRKGCRCVKCRDETNAARNARRYRDGTRRLKDAA